MKRCVYCGQPVTPHALACLAHRDLLELDPKYARVVVTRTELAETAAKIRATR